MLSELELRQVDKAMQSLLKPRVVPHVMSGGQVSYRVKGHEVVLYTMRPHYRDHSNLLEFELAKFKFVRTTKLWHLYWQRANGKWEGYEPRAISKQLDELAREVLVDPHGCFWG
jgi:hypothetical protein